MGDCSGPMSGGHYFSAGLLRDDKVFVYGFDWCKDKPKQVGKNSLVKNVLCKGHNERLSILDDEAIKAFDIFRQERELDVRRTKMKPRYWGIKEWYLKGPLLERWFLKALIGLACEDDRKIGPDAQEPGQPSPSTVRIAYGLEKFQGMAGLYILAAVGTQITMQDRLEYIPMAHPDCLPGGLFCFGGYSFVLHLGVGGLDPNCEIMLPGPLPYGGMSGGGMNVRPMYHPKAFKFDVHRRTSHVVRIKWPGELN